MKSLIALSLLICLATASPSKADDLYISISFTMGVHGTRGSAWTKDTYTIRGNKVVYQQTHGGEIASERQPVPVRKEYTFTAQEMKNLKRYINERDLLRSRSEISPPGDVVSPYAYYDLTEEIRWQGKKSLINVSGLRRSLHSDAMKDSQLYQDADSLLEYVRAAVNLRGSTIRASVQH